MASYADSRLHAADRVIFVTGGAGTICSVQTKAMVYLGANACIIGRNVEKTESMAREIAAVRKGAKVLGIGAIDVRNVSVPVLRLMLFRILTAPQFDSLKGAVDRCVKELGQIDFVMWV